MKRTKFRAPMTSQRGMTLIEIMVVIAIIGIVMTAIGIGVVGYLDDAKKGSVKAQLRKVSMGVQQYRNVEGELPNDLQAVVDRKYIKANDTKDAWKQDYIYTTGVDNHDGFRICSGGSDMSMGSGDDDICSDDEDGK